jgi:serine/threonine protein kinase
LAGLDVFVGFGIASRLPRERQSPEPPERIAGTPAYMAPEQSGRMNGADQSRRFRETNAPPRKSISALWSGHDEPLHLVHTLRAVCHRSRRRVGARRHLSALPTRPAAGTTVAWRQFSADFSKLQQENDSRNKVKSLHRLLSHCVIAFAGELPRSV